MRNLKIVKNLFIKLYNIFVIGSLFVSLTKKIISMDAKFSPRVKDVISYSREEAMRLGHDFIGVEHLLLGIIREGEGIAVKMIVSSGVDTKELRKKLDLYIYSA